MPIRRVLVLVVISCLGLIPVLTGGSRTSAANPGLSYLPDDLASAFVPAADALQCSLLDRTSGNGAGILGQDGGFSYLHNGTTYWTWSDTYVSSAPGYVSNTASTSSPAAPRMPAPGVSPLDTPCFPMQYKTQAGAAAEVLPPPAPGCVDWPTQLVAPSDGSTTLDFIYARHALTDAATACSLPLGAGIGSFDTTTMTATRLDATPVWTEVPGQAVQVTGGMPLRADDGDGEYIYLFLVAGGDPEPLNTTAAVALARVPPLDFGTPAAYRYWNGATWVTWDAFKSIDVRDNAHFLWRQPDFGIQAGVKVSYVAHLHKWVAMYSSFLAGDIRLRTADHLTGPWSRESRIVDCHAQLASLPPHVGSGSDTDWPCYGGSIHDELTSPDGLTIYVSFARNNWTGSGGDYRVYLRRFNLASPVSEWVDAAGKRTLVAGSGRGEGTRQGLAFFESEVPLPWFAPIHAYDAQPALPPDRIYSASTVAPAGYVDQGIAFYAPKSVVASLGERVVGVHAVRLASGQHAYTIGTIPAGATDEGVVFGAISPNPDVDADGVPNAADNCLGPNPDQTDTDHDGAGDACDLDDDNDNIGDVQLVNAPFPFAPRDNCPTTPNTDQADADGDGLGNACELSIFGTDPANADTDGDGCGDGREIRLGLSPLNKYDFYSVPVPALISSPNPAGARSDRRVLSSDAQAIFTYFKAGARPGTAVYDQDLNQNGVKDGLEYDRSVIGPGESGPPVGGIGAQQVMLAFAQFQRGYQC